MKGERADRSARRRLDPRYSLMAACLLASAAIVAEIMLTLYFALRGSMALTCVFAACAIALLFFSNLWLWQRVIVPLRGLGETARRIAGGGYGSLADKQSEDEIGELTDVINDMSVKIAEASNTQSDFISSVSHELRTPLTAITGWSETLLYDEAIQGDSRRGLEIISGEGARLTSMVEELLDFTRMKDGRFTLNMREVELEPLLDELAFTFGALRGKKGPELRYTPPEEPLPVLRGDPERLKQVILNLLDNAYKYGRSGGLIEMSVKTDNKYVSISIRDHGPGIAPEDLPHVKEKFYKGHSRERGSGIGLALCQEIVDRHGGRLTVRNAADGGAEMIVGLPLPETHGGTNEQRQ